MALSLALALITIALILAAFCLAGYILAASEEVYQSFLGEDQH